MLTPCITAIEARWKPEVVQQPDVVQIDGNMREVSRPVTLQQELKIRLDWFEQVPDGNGGTNAVSRFYREFTWGAKEIPKGEFLDKRVAASELIGDKSLFAKVAVDLYKKCTDEVGPVASTVSFAMPSYVPAFPVARLRIYLPYHLPAERLVELDVHHYLDAECKLSAFKKTKQWASRQYLESRQIEGQTPCEALLNDADIEPNVIKTVHKCGELVQSIFPLFNVDLEAWTALAQAAVDAFNPEPVAVE
jgi:hypothetical protein